MLDNDYFHNLEYPLHDAKVTKEISYSNSFVFDKEIKQTTFKIEEDFYLISKSKEEKATAFLEEYLNTLNNTNYVMKGTFFLHKYKVTPKYPYEGQDKVRQFLTAIRIYKNIRCSSNVHFSIKNSRKREYYKPFSFDKNPGDDIYYSKNKSRSLSLKDLNKIKTVYKRLSLDKFRDHNHYSKLHNATKFFNHGYDENWTLLKTTLFFIALESLFSDSSKSEVTFKVALRASFLLYPKNILKRKETFNFIKRGYEIRSNFVHGSDAENNVTNIINKLKNQKNTDDYWFHDHFIAELGEIVSGCLSKILLNKEIFDFYSKNNNSSKNENIFFDKLVMG